MSTSRASATLAVLWAGALPACGSTPDLATGAFVPASHPALPRVVSAGGPVLSTPSVQPIFYPGDAARADLESFLHTLAATTWSAQTAEYGVGPLAILPTIVLGGPAPKALADTDVQQMIAESTSGPAPAWGAADASTLYVLFTPPGTTVTRAGPLTSCVDFDAFHGEASLEALTVPYVVGSACPGFDGPTVTDLQERTVALSHELYEASTDPFPDSSPAYDGADGADAVWTLATGGEIADLCQFDLDPYSTLPGSTFFIQRTWSNQAAQAGTNPCVPAPPGVPYFTAVPVMPDMVALGDPSLVAPGVAIPAGGSKTIAVSLSSDAPTSGPWTVTAMDVNQLNGGKAELAFSLDRNSGKNGDTLHLTITVIQPDPTGVETFFLVSDLDGVSNLWPGAVGQ